MTILALGVICSAVVIVGLSIRLGYCTRQWHHDRLQLRRYERRLTQAMLELADLREWWNMQFPGSTDYPTQPDVRSEP